MILSFGALGGGLVTDGDRAVAEDRLVDVGAAAGGLGDLEVDDRVEAGDLGGVDVVGHAGEDLVEHGLAGDRVAHAGGELLVAGAADPGGEGVGTGSDDRLDGILGVAHLRARRYSPRRRRRRRRTRSTPDPVDDRLGRLRHPRRRPAESPRAAAVVGEAGGLARRQGEVDDPAGGVHQPPVALASVGQLHRPEPSLVSAGEVEVGLGADVAESVEAAVAAAVALVGEAGIERRLDLALQRVGRGQPALRSLGGHGT